MLVDAQYLSNTKKLVVSYVNHEGEIKMKYYDWESPYRYEPCSYEDPHRDKTYKSWDGKHVKKVSSYPDRYSIYEFLDALPKEEQEEIYAFNEPNIFFIDIETEVDPEIGFPEPSEAPTRIQSLSIVYDDKILILGQEDLDAEQQRIIMEGNTDSGGDIVGVNKYFEDYDTKYIFKYIKYEDEFDMLYAFFNKMVHKMPCMTGWNFIDFDWTFLVNRARKLKKEKFGKVLTIDPRVSSHTRRLNNIWGTNYEVPAHRIIFDYMRLYEALDTSVKVKESSSLDFVSKNLLGVKKIEYSGSLMDLHDDDYTKFIYYNAVDSVLVQLIHQKMMYINIIYGISSLSKIKIVDVFNFMNNSLASLAITEGVLRGRFRDNESVVLFKDKTKVNTGSSGLKGGWVKDPNVGMNRWVACYDFASLYPTTQRQFYISPENYKGMVTKYIKIKSKVGEIQILDKTTKEIIQQGDNIEVLPEEYLIKFNNVEETLNISANSRSFETDSYEIERYCIDEKGSRLLVEENDVVCSNGAVFLKRYSPTLQMLDDVYSDRKKNKNMMKEKKIELEKVLEEIKELENELQLS